MFIFQAEIGQGSVVGRENFTLNMATIVNRYCMYMYVHRGRMYNEEKAKVVAAVWGTEFKINLFNSVPRYSCFSLG